MSALAPILQAFFTDRLLRERRASALTVAAYRDAWRLLLRFAAKRLIFLGDSFHDGGGPDRLAAPDRTSLAHLQRGRDWIWIAGNHDPDPSPQIGGTFVQRPWLSALWLKAGAIITTLLLFAALGTFIVVKLTSTYAPNPTAVPTTPISSVDRGHNLIEQIINRDGAPRTGAVSRKCRSFCRSTCPTRAAVA